MFFCLFPKLLCSTQHCFPAHQYCRPQCTEIQHASSNIVLDPLNFVVRTLLNGMLERTVCSLISYQPRKFLLNMDHFHHLNHRLKAEYFVFRCTVYLYLQILGFYQLLELVSLKERRRRARGMRRIIDLQLFDLCKYHIYIDTQYVFPYIFLL